jgi:hypothetical protein
MKSASRTFKAPFKILEPIWEPVNPHGCRSRSCASSPALSVLSSSASSWVTEVDQKYQIHLGLVRKFS